MRWSGFTVEALTEKCEVDIIDRWLEHMQQVTERLDLRGEPPLVFHWSHAEQSTFETAFNSACERHPGKGWTSPRWFDFLKDVVRAEPVVVRGDLSFGPKTVAKELHALGYIRTEWDAGPTDGLGAMVGARSCAREATSQDCPLWETQLMMEIVGYLRKNH